MTILTVLGVAVGIKAFSPETTSAATRQAVLRHTSTVDTGPATTVVEPTSAIESRAEFFIGTGGGSAGSWVRP
jgi:hypothetical protein